MLCEGQKAPPFTLKDHSGKAVKLADLKGQQVVLYFYPRDLTSGCTVEACAFRDRHSKLREAGAVVLGVSPDSQQSHQKFIDKHELPFALLVDQDHAVAERYGAWAEKSLYGRRFMGIVRSTFLIGPDGRLKKVWPKVKVSGHAEDVLAAVQSGAQTRY